MGMTNQKPMALARETRRFNEESGKASRKGNAYRYRYTNKDGKEFLDVLVAKGKQSKVRAKLEAQLNEHGLELVLFEPR